MILEATLTLFQSVLGALCCATLVLGQIGEMPLQPGGGRTIREDFLLSKSSR